MNIDATTFESGIHWLVRLHPYLSSCTVVLLECRKSTFALNLPNQPTIPSPMIYDINLPTLGVGALDTTIRQTPATGTAKAVIGIHEYSLHTLHTSSHPPD